MTLALLIAALAPSASPPAIPLQAGEILRYESKEEVTLRQADAKGPLISTTTVRQVREWEVERADRNELALALTIVEFAFDQANPDGDVVRYDSANTTQAHPDLVGYFAPLVGNKSARIRLQRDGTVLSAERLVSDRDFHLESPFFIPLTAPSLQTGQAWTATSQAPVGSPKPSTLSHQCKVTERIGDKAVIQWGTRPADAGSSENPAITTYLLRGTMTFDARRGKVVEANLSIDEPVKTPDGVFHLTSQRQERWIDSPRKIAGGK